MAPRNIKKCSTNSDCVCINCLLKEKMPKNNKIKADTQNTYCIDLSVLIKDIKLNIGDFEADEFWLSILSLKTHFDDYYKEIVKIIDNEEFYRRTDILSSSMLIDWDGSYNFKKIFVEYLKLRNLHPNVEIYMDGQIYFYVDFRYEDKDSKLKWINQPVIFCTIGINYGKTSSSNLNKKFETEIPFNGPNNYIWKELFDLIRLVSKNHNRNLKKIGEENIPKFKNQLKTFLENVEYIVSTRIIDSYEDSLKILNERLIPSVDFMFGINR